MASLDLNNHKRAVLQSDYVSLKAGAAPVAFNDEEPVSFKIGRGDLFAPCAG